MKFYKRDPDAALAGMAELTMQERGAYNTIIDLLYSRDGVVADDDEMLRRVLGCHGNEWRAVKAKLIAKGKIRVEAGMIKARRVDEVISEAEKLSTAQRERVGKRWETRRKLDGNSADSSRKRDGNAPHFSENPNEINDPSIPLIAIAKARVQSLTEQSDRPDPKLDKTDLPSTSPAAKKNRGRRDVVTNGSIAFESYAASYAARYGQDPVRNARTNAAFAKLVSLVPPDEAAAVASFFVSCNRPAYVNARHAPNLLIRDAEAIRTEWLNGTEASQAAPQRGILAAAARVQSKLEARHVQDRQDDSQAVRGVSRNGAG